MYNIVIQQLHIIWNVHHNKYSYHLSPYKVTTISLTIFPMLYITISWLIYFITRSLHPSILSSFLPISPQPIPRSNSQFVLCIIGQVLCTSFYFHFEYINHVLNLPPIPKSLFWVFRTRSMWSKLAWGLTPLLCLKSNFVFYRHWEKSAPPYVPRTTVISPLLR